MVMIEPVVSVERRYSPKETAELLGIHRNTLRTYTSDGLIRCNWHRETMRKFYQGQEILRFWKATI